MKTKRKVDLVVISDVHLGTYGCHAKELLTYLKSIKPGKLILNGDIVDMWQFSKRYWPKSHMKVVKYIMKLVSEGVEVVYITGNHDEMLRKFVGLEIGSFKIENKLVFECKNEKKAWLFHGDIFDVTMQHSKWLAKLGAVGYDTLILINRLVNVISEKMGRGKISLSKKIKDSVKSAVKFINDFEKTAADIAISNGYDYVICGHIHQPVIKEVTTEKGSVIYLNSGDWIENLTSLEYHKGTWSIYQYDEANFQNANNQHDLEDINMDLDNSAIFRSLLQEFNITAVK